MKSTSLLLLNGVNSLGTLLRDFILCKKTVNYPLDSLFITNTTISFKMKYPNLADVLDTAAPGIDHSKILSYGCQCQFLDGRPLAASGNGHPVDPIDAACKQYRECQTCAQMDDGADCNVENVDWMYRIDLDVPQLDCLDPGMIPFRFCII